MRLVARSLVLTIMTFSLVGLTCAGVGVGAATTLAATRKARPAERHHKKAARRPTTQAAPKAAPRPTTQAPHELVLTGNPLVIPGSEALQEVEAPPGPPEVVEEPTEPVAEREASSTKFESLSGAQAEKVAEEAFGHLVDETNGGPPTLPVGEKITGYAANNVAGIDLGGGHAGIVESLQPMAVPTASGRLVPIDLTLRDAGNAYEPQTAAVGVAIPKHLAAGIAIPSTDVSVTPTDTQGEAESGEGVQIGASVFYANTATDSDTLVKPTTEGLDISTVLRSSESPQRLQFHLAVPEGAKLEQKTVGSGPVTITANGVPFALVRPPRATDAGGTYVPVSMSVEGNSVILDVASHSKPYLWPIAVDPELATTTDNSISEKSTWKWHASDETPPPLETSEHWKHTWFSNTLEIFHEGPTSGVGEYVEGQYPTQGESQIYKVAIESAGYVKKARAKLELAHEGVVEKKVTIAENTYHYGETPTTLCGNAECSSAGGHATNIASFKIEATEPVSET